MYLRGFDHPNTFKRGDFNNYCCYLYLLYDFLFFERPKGRSICLFSPARGDFYLPMSDGRVQFSNLESSTPYSDDQGTSEFYNFMKMIPTFIIKSDDMKIHIDLQDDYSMLLLSAKAVKSFEENGRWQVHPEHRRETSNYTRCFDTTVSNTILYNSLILSM